MATVFIGEVLTEAGVQDIAQLWREYWATLGLGLDFQGFGEEAAGLPGKYAAPDGGLWLASVDGQPAAAIALRRLGPESCEAKRLYVRPEYRRLGIARRLMEAIIKGARERGYRDLYGDTLPCMTSAQLLYADLGFIATRPYSNSPTPGASYMHLDLTREALAPESGR